MSDGYELLPEICKKCENKKAWFHSVDLPAIRETIEVEGYRCVVGNDIYKKIKYCFDVSIITNNHL